MFEVSVIEDLEDEAALARERGDLAGESAAGRVRAAPWACSRLKRRGSWPKEYAQTVPAEPRVRMPLKAGCASGWRGFLFSRGGPRGPGRARRRHGPDLAAMGFMANTLKRMSQRTVA